jgi:hypothetical protein
MEGFKQELLANYDTMTRDEFHKFVTDFKVKKKPKLTTPAERCLAKLSSGDQCSRSRQEGKDFCGSHVTKTPYGVVNQSYVTLNVWLQSIDGILYYIDDKENVYRVEDINDESVTPFAKYVKEGDTFRIII